MNKIESGIQHHNTHIAREPYSAQVDEIICDLIRFRIQLTESHASQNWSYTRKRTILPPYSTQQISDDILFQTQELWIPVDGYTFIADRVVKACFTHKSGVPQSLRNSSVFWAMRKDVVKKRWDISPVSATAKQRFQFWDHTFVAALIASIQEDESSASLLHNKISYHRSDTVTAEQLLLLRQQVHEECATMIVQSSSDVYESLRGKYAGI